MRGLITGIALGVGAMYLLDPNRGRNRRAMLRDRMASGASRLRRELERGTQDLGNRAEGLKARGRQLMSHQTPDDEVMVSRVRSAIGHVVSKPHNVEVMAEGGRVTLRGEVYQDEISGLLKRVRSVAGVSDVVDEMDTLAENAPAREMAGARTWTPALRLAALAGGGVLTLYGVKKRGLLGTAGASLGGTLVRRAMGRG